MKLAQLCSRILDPIETKIKLHEIVRTTGIFVFPGVCSTLEVEMYALLCFLIVTDCSVPCTVLVLV